MIEGGFSEKFKREAAAQIVERGYRVAQVSQRLGVSQHSLYAWKKKLAETSRSSGDERDAQIRRLKRELVRVIEERDIDLCVKLRRRIADYEEHEKACLDRHRARSEAGRIKMSPTGLASARSRKF
jgi:transposase